MTPGLSASDRAARKLGVTASDAPAIAGLSPFAGPMDVYVEKTDPDAPEREVDEAVEAGQWYEEPSILRWGARTGALVTAKPPTLVHPGMPWVRATPDRGVLRPGAPALAAVNFGSAAIAWWDACLEFKWVTSSLMSEHWGTPGTDQVPAHTGCQAQWQMAVTGTPVCIVVVVMFGRDLVEYLVPRDDAIIGALLETCGDFWTRHVLARVPPPCDGSEAGNAYLKRRFPQHGPKLIAAPPEATEVLDDYVALGETLKASEKARTCCAQKLKGFIGENLGLKFRTGEIVTWKADVNGSRSLHVKQTKQRLWAAVRTETP